MTWEALVMFYDDIDDVMGLVKLGMTPGAILTVTLLTLALATLSFAPSALWTLAGIAGVMLAAAVAQALKLVLRT